jgi:hypothetical protein
MIHAASLRLSSHHASVEGDATTVRPAVGARDQARRCGALSGLTIISPLSFPLALLDGRTIETIGDAANYLAGLPEEELGQHQWTVAIRMLDHALTEATYLKTATICFQTALAMHGVLAGPLKR